MGSCQSNDENKVLEEFNWNDSIEASDLNLLFDLNEQNDEASQPNDEFSTRLTTCVENCLEGKLKDLKTLNIVVVGITGSGKSTLINNVFRENFAQEGFGSSVTEQITKYNKPGINLNIFDTPGFELSEPKQKELLKGLTKIHNTKDISQMIHCMLYCVKSESQRLQEYEKEFIIKVTNHSDLKKIPIIIVITQSIDIQASNELKQHIESLNLNIVGVVPVLAKSRRIYGNNDYIEREAFGLEELIGTIQNNLPDILHETLNNVQNASIKYKRNSSIGIISSAVTASAVVGGSPIPFTDVALLIPIEIGMLTGITAIYGINVLPKKILLIISFTLYNGATSFLVRSAAVNAIKCIPGIGSIVGGVISGSSAAFITAAIGATYLALLDYVFKKNIDINSLDPDELKEIVQPIFREKMGNR